LVEFYRSADNGRTWTRPEKSPIRGVVPGLIQLRDGALLVNVTQFDEDKDYRQYLVVYRSTDNGRTWTGPATLARHPQRQPNEGGFVQLATGEVICYMRDDEYSLKNSTGLKTISRDGGLTWSPAHGSGPWCYSGRPCPGQLKDGSVLVTTRVRNAPQAGNWFGLYLEPAETALQANPLDSAPPPQARWTLLDNDTHKERPDWGYSGWVELADGSLFIVQYTADGAPKDKTCIRGYRLPKGWPGKLGRGDGAPDKPAPPDKKPQSSGSTPDS
jgi:sialidase-1